MTIAALIAAALASQAPAATVTPAQASALGQEAYLYGFPLLEVLRTRATATSVRCPDTHGNAPINVFSNAAKFANPSTRAVVAPNVDTLYSISHLDLGKGPVVLSHPDMGKRYFVFELLDAYTNSFAFVGSRTTGAKAGRFAITWSARRGTKIKGARTVVSPTRRVWVIGRTLADDRADQRAAYAQMKRYSLTPPGGAPVFSKRCKPGKVTKATTPTGLAFLDALGRALRDNPPPARDAPLLARLRTVGVGPGLRPEKAGLPQDVLDALVSGVTVIGTALPGAAAQSINDGAVANGGWSIPADNIGDYGTDYRFRAGVASVGLGANTRDEAIYPTGLLDSEGRKLDGTKSYRITFAKGEEPPVRAFWSLTLYDADGYLVRNTEDRYAIGISHPPLVRKPDGSVVVVLQGTKPAEAGVNWLPTPAEPFRLNLRLYWPKPSVLAHTWRPPPIELATP
jgi:hypothetical protein